MEGEIKVLTMKQVTIDSEKDSLGNKLTQIGSQVMLNASQGGATMGTMKIKSVY